MANFFSLPIADQVKLSQDSLFKYYGVTIPVTTEQSKNNLIKAQQSFTPAINQINSALWQGPLGPNGQPNPARAAAARAANNAPIPPEIKNQLTSLLPSGYTFDGTLGQFANALNAVSTSVNNVIQNEIQLRSMQNSYSYLQQLGLLKGTETLRELGTLVQVATKFGATLTAQWVAGKTSPNITGSINIVAKQAQYALGFSLLNSATFASNVQQAEGYTDTVNRETVQSAMSKIIGNPKVPTPTYNTPVIG